VASATLKMKKMTAPKAKRFGFAEFTLTTFQNLTK
jgi:hypothetical protein